MSKIGLVLGSGGAKGIAHIGVLKVLEKNNIKIDVITGTSMGALVGGLYASSLSINEIERLAVETKFKKVAGKVELRRLNESLLKNIRVKHFIESNLKKKRIEDFQIKFGCIATDLRNGEEIVFTKGDAVIAIHSSTTLPGIFKSIEYQNHLLVDGGLVNPLPIDLAKKLGADKIICVDVMSKFNTEKIKPNILNAALNSVNIFEKRINDFIIEKEKPDILIVPPLNNYRAYHFNKAEELIKIGEQEANGHLEELRSF